MTLAERSARSGIGAESVPGDHHDDAPSGIVAAKHCWVVDSPLSPGRWPGLLLGWRRREAGWQGLAVWVVNDDDSSVLLQAWLAAEHLQAQRGAAQR